MWPATLWLTGVQIPRHHKPPPLAAHVPVEDLAHVGSLALDLSKLAGSSTFAYVSEQAGLGNIGALERLLVVLEDEGLEWGSREGLRWWS